MILFEFYCEDCKKEFEELVSSSDSNVRCPFCGSKNTKKLISAVKVTGSEQSRITSNSSCSSTGGFA